MMRTSSQQPKIAIIGAGASGLAAARVVSRSGLASPKVFEKNARKTGGVWNYVSNSTSDPVYRGLRTNLPKEIMGYRELPWLEAQDGGSFVTHRDVARYLESYRDSFRLGRYIHHGHSVRQLTVLSDQPSALSPDTETWPKIRLSWTVSETDQQQDQQHGHEHGKQQLTSTGEEDSNVQSDVFDAVLICNGHYAKASSPRIPGLDQYFQGKVMHSIEYDDPAMFQSETVLCIGARASGADLTREIMEHADYVYLSDSTCPPLVDGQPETADNGAWVPKTTQVLQDGSIQFGDKETGITIPPNTIDRIIMCSGYDYEFPFLNDDSNLDVQFPDGERRVKPLYRQLWHAHHPNLAFVGLPHSILPFPFFELQAEAVCATWTAASVLPSVEDRLNAAQQDSVSCGGVPNGRIQDTHYLGNAQWDYCRDLAKTAGIYDADMEGYISVNKEIYDAANGLRKGGFPGGPDTYRSFMFDRDFVNHEYSLVEPAEVRETSIA